MYSKVKLNVPNLEHEYTIDTDGVIQNVTRGYTLRGTSITKNNRYVKAHLDKFHALHRLVAQHFVPNPDNLPQVNHKDGNRYNNTAANLEWCTSRDNVKHAYRTGLKTNAGEVNPFSKLTEAQVTSIWAMRFSPLTARQIRDRLQLRVSIAAIKAVRQGKNWTHITSGV